MQLQQEVDRRKDDATTKATHHERLISGLEEKVRHFPIRLNGMEIDVMHLRLIICERSAISM